MTQRVHGSSIGTKAKSGSVLALAVSLAVAGCGGAPAPTKDADPGSASASSAPASSSSTAGSSAKADAEGPAGLPDKCEKKGDICAPSPKFVKRLCGGFNPDVALIFFRKGSPFTRAYLRGAVEAWNASGGSSSADKLAFDEEVIVLLERKQDAGGMQVSGAGGGFDVLRWDGSCATLAPEEITFNLPPKPKNAKLSFKDLGDTTQEVLLKNEKIAKLNADRRKECKGATMGEVSAKCVKLVDQLSDLVAGYVREGGEIPTPTKLP